MSIMIDLPPAMAQEAREYATVQGTTIERMLFECRRLGCQSFHMNPIQERLITWHYVC